VAVIAHEQYDQRAFYGIQQQSCHRQALVAGAQHVGGADVARADGADVAQTSGAGEQ
jgi:hypothetical protein